MVNEPQQESPISNPLLELLHKAAAGDESAATRLLAEIRPYLKTEIEKLAGSQLRARQDVSDVVQECLMAVWRNTSAVQGTTETEFRAWLKVIARREFLDALRHERQQMRDVRQQIPLPQDGGGGVTIADDNSSPSQQAIRREEDDRRERALGRLAPDHRQVLQLRFSEGRAWPEVAARMGRSEMAVRRLYYCAVQRWKQETGDES